MTEKETVMSKKIGIIGDGNVGSALARGAGPLANARLLEPLALLNIQLGYVLGLGGNIGTKLVRG